MGGEKSNMQLIKQLQKEKYDWSYQSIEIPEYHFKGRSKDYETWDIIKSLISFKDKKVADISCFHGYFSIKMAKEGAIVDGYDANENILKNAKKFSEMNGTQINFELFNASKNILKQNYDLVICLSALHYYNKDFFLNGIKDKANEFIFEVNDEDIPLIERTFLNHKKLIITSTRHPKRSIIYFAKVKIIKDIVKRPGHFVRHVKLGDKEYIMKTSKLSICPSGHFLVEHLAYQVDKMIGINVIPKVILIQYDGLSSLQEFINGEVPVDFYANPERYDFKGELALIDLLINNYDRNEHNIMAKGRRIYATDNSESFKPFENKSRSYVFFDLIPHHLISIVIEKEEEIYKLIRSESKKYQKDVTNSIPLIKKNIAFLKSI